MEEFVCPDMFGMVDGTAKFSDGGNSFWAGGMIDDGEVFSAVVIPPPNATWVWVFPFGEDRGTGHVDILMEFVSGKLERWDVYDGVGKEGGERFRPGGAKGVVHKLEVLDVPHTVWLPVLAL